MCGRFLCDFVGVAALTCEATRASTAAFEAANFEVRPHRGQMDCAERLRLMLEGSKSCNSKKASSSRAIALSVVCKIVKRNIMHVSNPGAVLT